MKKSKRCRGHPGWVFLFLIVGFVFEGCNTCWQCAEKKKNEITIGQEAKELLEVKFESANERDLFFTAMCERQRKIKKVLRAKGLSLYYPRVIFWNEEDIEIVSQNTVANEHIRSCDTDGNLVITNKEAKIYHDANEVGEENE